MSQPTFEQLQLDSRILSALSVLGYEAPTPVQAASIPHLLNGEDLLGQAQTGTGKTAAFTLPLLSQIDIDNKTPQGLIIAPTRELAIQVAQACQSYAKFMNGLSVVPIYGGQDYAVQNRALKRGVHIIVGTPGRIMDHMRRGNIKLDALKMLILDEADEMLKMGFVDDIEWILEHIKHEHQTALFSATMPKPILKIVDRYLTNAKKIHIQADTTKVDAIEQRYLRINNKQKLNALIRILEVEQPDGAIIFTRTKGASNELSEKLQALGYRASALNGDMTQELRRKTIDRVKNHTLDIVVATDVAARGIDIARISHVFNYDIPFDSEAYVHRIGRTGRAGRSGKAFMFINPREQRLLRDIEKTIGKPIELMHVPSAKEMQSRRDEKMIDTILSVIDHEAQQEQYKNLLQKITDNSHHNTHDVALALLHLLSKGDETYQHDIDTADEAAHQGKSKGKGAGRRHRDRGPSRSNAKAQHAKRGFERRKTKSKNKAKGKPEKRNKR